MNLNLKQTQNININVIYYQLFNNRPPLLQRTIYIERFLEFELNNL